MFRTTIITQMDTTMNLCVNRLGERFYLPELNNGGIKVPFYAVISDQTQYVNDVSPLWDEMIDDSFKVIGAAFQRRKDAIDWLTIPVIKSFGQFEPDEELMSS
jgi:hypothetical protein